VNIIRSDAPATHHSRSDAQQWQPRISQRNTRGVDLTLFSGTLNDVLEMGRMPQHFLADHPCFLALDVTAGHDDVTASKTRLAERTKCRSRIPGTNELAPQPARHDGRQSSGCRRHEDF